MKHYINEDTGEIYGYAADGSQDAFIAGGLTPITNDEAAALLAARNPPQDRAAEARATRNELLRTVYDPAVAMLLRKQRLAGPDEQHGIAAKLAEFDAYAVKLQGVPEQDGFPDAIDWPPAPENQ